jgi:uncharacterized protein
MDIDIVLYHGNCPDGTGAAWVFLHYNPKIHARPVNHGQAPPLDLAGKHVVIVDFSYPFETTMTLQKEVKTLTILDHHKTARTNLTSLPPADNTLIIFDMERSGAQIAWDFVYPYLPRPWFIDYIGDRDLWKFKLPNSKDITAYMNYVTISFDNLERYFADSSAPLEKYAAEGRLINLSSEKEINVAVDGAILCTITLPDKKYTVWLTTASSEYRSEIGNRLSKKMGADFAVVWRYNILSDEWYCSCRASDNSTIDLSQILKPLGGGGHPKAAGFCIASPNTLRRYFIPVGFKSLT